MYLYYAKEKTSGWEIQRVKTARERETLAEKVQPKYITVLDVSDDIQDDTPLEDVLKARYRGPFYADWDCPDIMEGVESVRRFLTLLQEKYEVNPHCVRLYATGGRGFHAEVPFALFCSSRNNEVISLPHIWREIANELYTEHLDMAVYSARRGRMWRTPNVERETKGRYKVPISYEQLLHMTQETYDELCSSPQPWPPLAPVDAVSSKLATLYELTKQKVEKVLRSRAKAKEQNKALEAFAGEWPQSAVKLMNGDLGTNPDIGLNKIALQLSILATGLGKSLEDLLEACKGLIDTYRGDGHKTRSSVRKELIRIFNYVNGNPCYSYSPGGLISIYEDKSAAVDVNGMPTVAAGVDGKLIKTFADLTQGMLVGTNGVFSMKGEDGLQRETNWHFDPETVTELVDAVTHQPKGFMLVGMDNGVVQGEVNVDHATFVSGDKAKMFLAGQGATAPRLDSIKAGGMLSLIMSSARDNDRVLTIDKEGFNLITLPTGEEDLVWTSPSGCYAKDAHARYRYRSSNGSEAGNFKSDVLAAPPLADLPEAAETLMAMLNINSSDFTVATLVGWMAACWLKPFHMQRSEASFPLLQSYGESGSGKTAVNVLLMKMFYHRNPPVLLNAGTGTAFGRRVLFGSATSIPLYIDEFKPRQMAVNDVKAFKALIHEIYTPIFAAPRGGGDAHSNKPGQWAELSMDVKTTPVAFSTENAETETAIVERVLSVPFSKVGRVGRSEQFRLVSKNSEVLSALGRSLLNAVMYSKRETLQALIARSEELAQEALNRTGNSRIVYNVSCAVSGLGLLQMALTRLLPHAAEGFTDRLNQLRAALLDPSNYSSLTSVPELVKMLRFMVRISHNDDPQSDYMPRPGREFSYSVQGHLDLDVDALFLRYSLACKRYNHQQLFPDVEGLQMALRLFHGLRDVDPVDSDLLNSESAARIVRLDSAAMSEHQVGMFKI